MSGRNAGKRGPQTVSDLIVAQGVDASETISAVQFIPLVISVILSRVGGTDRRRCGMHTSALCARRGRSVALLA